ncbi:MAG: MopE-related protein [Myxococcota bacterium]
MIRCTTLSLLAMLLLAAGCSDDSTETPDEGDTAPMCGADEYLDELTNTCVSLGNGDTGPADTMEPVDTEIDTTVVPDTSMPDVPPDTTVEDEMIDPACDQDNDGALSMACGGDDCDDDDFRRAPVRSETCDEIDNNCDGNNNEGISCTFYAHTGDDLYTIDPFTKSATRVSDVPNLFDIDTHPDGTLYGITARELYFYQETQARWFEVGAFPTIDQGTGFAIDGQGTAFVTAGESVYEVDLATAETMFIGNLGGSFFSSGDCVVNKANTLFMTSKANSQPDSLVLVDRTTGMGQLIGQIRSGNTSYSSIFGLTAGWGQLYGLNTRGELINIDPSDGTATLIHTFTDNQGQGLRWFGAASTPDR